MILFLSRCKKTPEFIEHYNEYVKLRNRYNELTDAEKTELDAKALVFGNEFSDLTYILSVKDSAAPVYDWAIKHLQNNVITGDNMIYYEFPVDKMNILITAIDNKIDTFGKTDVDSVELQSIRDGIALAMLDKSYREYCFLYAGVRRDVINAD